MLVLSNTYDRQNRQTRHSNVGLGHGEVLVKAVESGVPGQLRPVSAGVYIPRHRATMIAAQKVHTELVRCLILDLRHIPEP